MKVILNSIDDDNELITMENEFEFMEDVVKMFRRFLLANGFDRSLVDAYVKDVNAENDAVFQRLPLTVNVTMNSVEDADKFKKKLLKTSEINSAFL